MNNMPAPSVDGATTGKSDHGVADRGGRQPTSVLTGLRPTSRETMSGITPSRRAATPDAIDMGSDYQELIRNELDGDGDGI
mmetsp:Transcript_59798/g.122707  ORF Transcript_59798/g.122707 Transcript_59798/m.122707 type:complete len:81 (-) Transcript_59798:3404-3646(-)